MCPPSPSKELSMRSIAISRLLLAFVLTSILPASSRAQCLTNIGECVFPPNCAYLNENGANYPPNRILRVLWFENSNSCTPFPVLGGSLVKALDAIATRIDLSTDGGATYQIYSTIGQIGR